MSEAFSLAVLESLLGVHLPQEQRRVVIAQFLKGSPAGVVAASPAEPQGSGEQDAYDAAIERAFVAAFGAPRRPVAQRRGLPAPGRALPPRFRNAHSPSLRIAIEILAHRAAVDRAVRLRAPR